MSFGILMVHKLQIRIIQSELQTGDNLSKRKIDISSLPEFWVVRLDSDKNLKKYHVSNPLGVHDPLGSVVMFGII